VSYPTLFTTPGVKDFAQAVDAERQRQLEQFGDQRHRDGTSIANESWAEYARANCQQAADEGVTSWAGILYEEFTEAMAEEDPAKLRVELIQIAAVCAAWVTDIDSRSA
jgi:hypothetical protein